MNREDTLRAIDEAFADGVKHLYAVFVQGLMAEEPADKLADRFRKGVAFNCDAHAKTTAAVEDYFRSFKA